MDATGNILGASDKRRLGALIVAAASLIATATTTTADAAPMRGGARPVARASTPFVGPTLSPAWDAFLGMGPDGWAAYQSPAFTIPTRLAVWRMLGDAPGSSSLNPMLEYLLWRRDLNPARFDHYHPYLGPSLGQLLKPPPPPPPLVVPPVEIPQELPPITPPPPLVVPDLPVPEPGGLIIAAVASAWGLWRRWRLRPRTVPTPR